MREHVEVMLQEYRSLREESLEGIRARNQFAALAPTALGVLFLSGASLLGENESVAFAILWVAVPALSVLLYLIWAGEAHRSNRAGLYLAGLEERISREVEAGGGPAEPALRFEHYIREGRQFRYPYLAVTALLLGACVLSCAVAWWAAGFPTDGVVAQVLLWLWLAAPAVAFGWAGLMMSRWG